MTTPYLGSKISLISKAEIRYEGILYTIDTKESTVALAKVHSFGTEDRPTDRPVPPRDDVYDYIIFRGSDIKDLKVCAPPAQQAASLQDPAIVESSTPPTALAPNVGTYQQFGPPPGAHAPAPVVQPVYPAAVDPTQSTAKAVARPQVAEPTQKGSLASNQQLHKKSQSGPVPKSTQKPAKPASAGGGGSQRSQAPEQAPRVKTAPQQRKEVDVKESQNEQAQQHGAGGQGRGGYGRGRARGRGGRGAYNNTGSGRRAQGQKDPLKFDTDFDFDQANSEFKKEDIEKELKEKLNLDGSDINGDSSIYSGFSEEADDSVRCYDKTKSFFDAISSETTDNERRSRRPNWKEERKLNTETFGVSGSWRGGYRGRGDNARWRGGYNRGGNYRGGGRGGERGGHQHYGGERGGHQHYGNQNFVNYRRYQNVSNKEDGSQDEEHSRGYNNRGRGRGRGRRQWVNYDHGLKASGFKPKQDDAQ